MLPQLDLESNVSSAIHKAGRSDCSVPHSVHLRNIDDTLKAGLRAE